VGIGLNELALFAGAGGGILGGHLLGWRTVCAVEWEPYPASVLVQRQNDGILAPFPVWDDVRTFDGKPWRGIVDVVSGGFPCQDISAAGRGAGIEGERSGMWKEMARIIGEVRPRYAFVENSPMLTSRGIGTVLADLAALGFDAEWGVLSARDVGAIHLRERIWILASDNREKRIQGKLESKIFRQPRVSWSENVRGLQDLRNRFDIPEPLICRKSHGISDYVDRISAIGNAQYPGVAATAFTLLHERLMK
jgi:DNA (cytosine-5)-methyltransferase 1